jgi:hypothetical protein
LAAVALGLNMRAVNEIQRLAYLDAMGIDSFVSRRQLPGAAPTRRLCVVRGPAQVVAEPLLELQSEPQSEPRAEAPGTGRSAVKQAANARAPGLGSELRDSLSKPVDRASIMPERATSPGLAKPQDEADATPLFSLATCYVGGYFWLEEIPKSRELGNSYLHLLVNLGLALGLDCSRPSAERFDWPMHFNRHLDQGMESARHAFEGFLRARLERYSVHGVILLGDVNADLLSPGIFSGLETTVTVSARKMLTQPELKLQAWLDLKRLAHTPD